MITTVNQPASLSLATLWTDFPSTHLCCCCCCCQSPITVWPRASNYLSLGHIAAAAAAAATATSNGGELFWQCTAIRAVLSSAVHSFSFMVFSSARWVRCASVSWTNSLSPSLSESHTPQHSHCTVGALNKPYLYRLFLLLVLLLLHQPQRQMASAC